MKRIDHATIVTCRGDQLLVLRDASIGFSDGVIDFVAPTETVTAADQATGGQDVDIAQLKGRPLGAILVAIKAITQQQLADALESQRTIPGAIGQLLVDRGDINEYQVSLALDIQAGRTDQQHGRASRGDIIDGTGKLIVPGLVNTHHHLFQSVTRCLPEVQNAHLFEWLSGLYRRWRNLDHGSAKMAAMISIAELLLSGATITSDHMYMFPANTDVRLDAVIEAADSLGIRLHACRGSMTLGQSKGGLPPDECTESDQAVLEDALDVIERYHDSGPYSLRQIELAPCAPFNVTAELFDATRDLARAHGVRLHTHIAETVEEEQFCLERYNVRPIEYLQKHDWLGEDVYLAHCVQVNQEEIALLARTKTSVSHCPSSNMRLGSGIAPVSAMLDAGVRVGLAVDGSSSNDGGNLLAEGRQALLLQRVGGSATSLTAAQAFRMLTTGGAAVLGRQKLGELREGHAADMAIFDTHDPALAGAFAHDPVAALTMCSPPRPERVIIAGQSVVENGAIPGIDWPVFIEEFNDMVRSRFG